MKKSLIILTLAFCMPLISMAQESWNPKRELDVRLSYECYPGFSYGIVAAKADYNCYLTKNFSLGGGLGVSVPTIGKEIDVPLTLNLGWHFQAHKVVPYLSLQGGPVLAISLEDNDYWWGAVFGMISPSAGVKIPIGKKTALDLSLGYVRYGLFESGTDGIVFKAGFAFGYSHRNTVTARSRTAAASVHGGFCAGAETEYFTSADDGFHNTVHSMYGVRGYALWNAFVENLYAGISVGMGFNDYEKRYENSDYSESGKRFRYSIMPRVRYNVAAATIAGRVYPFAQVDAGFAYNGVHSQFAVEPAAGLSVKTTGDQSLDFSVGYLPKIYFESGSKTDGGSVRLAVGYTF